MYLTLKASGSDFFFKDAGVLIENAGSSFDTDPNMIQILAKSAALRALVIAGTVIVNDGSQDLAALAGQQYLNQMWLQAGNDVAVAMSQVEGTITDNQHGARGAGTLHPAADGANPGFLTAADFTKLAGVGPGSRPEVSAAMGDSNGPGVSTGSITPVVERYAIFVGTDVWTPTIFKVVGMTSGATGYVDVYDVTNGQVLATVSFSGSVKLVTTATLANLPTGQAIIAFRAYRGGTATTVTTYFAILTRT